MSGKEKEPLTELQQEIINTLKSIEEAKEFYFTPLECPAVYSGDENNFPFLANTGLMPRVSLPVRRRSLLTGFTGGSALSAYYLHHRVSEDMDFFTPAEDLIQLVSRKLKFELEKKGIIVNPIRNFKSFVEMIAERGEESMKIQFALDSPYRLGKTQNIEGTIVDSLLDIAAGKLLALFGRAAERDFVDIYFLVKEGYCSLDELIKKASEKDPGMDKYYLAIAFEHVRTLPDNPENLKLKLLKPLDMKDLKRLFIEKAVRLLEEAKSGNDKTG